MKKILRKTIASFALLTFELILVWTLLIVSFSVFFYFTKLVFVDNRTGLDEAAFAFTEANSSPAITSVLKFITVFASFPFLLVTSLSVAAFYLFIKKHKWYTVKIVAMALGGTLLNQGLKFFFERPRPTTEIENFSFPSGHAMIGLTFYGVMIYLAWKNIENKAIRYTVCGLLILLVLVISYSRVYLQVHYATDVIAGLAGGIFWLLTGLYILGRIERFSRKEINPVIEESLPPEEPENNYLKE